MNDLQIGGRVRVIAGIPNFESRVGRIIQIGKPYVISARMEAEALLEMRLYRVQFDDGGSFRFRGRDLQPVTVQARISREAHSLAPGVSPG